MSSTAFLERDIKAIKKRAQINFIYKGIKKILKILFRSKRIRTILVYPEITDQSALEDILNRIIWGFPNFKDLRIYIVVEDDLKNISLESLEGPQYQRSYLKDLTNIKLISSKELSKFWGNNSILIHKAKKIFDTSVLLRLHKVQIIDKNYFSNTEALAWQNLNYSTYTKKEHTKFSDLSKKNYSKFLLQNNKKAYCFATGPSFDRYEEFKFEDDSSKIICNTTIKNDKFLEYIRKPDLLVFADPVFHFGPCEYAAQFRDRVLEVVKKYKCYVMVPEKEMPYLLSNYPELKDFIIGMASKKGTFNFPSVEKFWVKGSSNIMTQLMFPVASAIANEIFIIGADGRKPEEKYFWKHSSSAQYDDLMKTVFETHPSFFRDRDYKDYYDVHCKLLEDLINFGEKLGRKYYSLTPSYIPVLSNKLFKDTE